MGNEDSGCNVGIILRVEKKDKSNNIEINNRHPPSPDGPLYSPNQRSQGIIGLKRPLIPLIGRNNLHILNLPPPL